MVRQAAHNAARARPHATDIAAPETLTYLSLQHSMFRCSAVSKAHGMWLSRLPACGEGTGASWGRSQSHSSWCCHCCPGCNASACEPSTCWPASQLHWSHACPRLLPGRLHCCCCAVCPTHCTRQLPSVCNTQCCRGLQGSGSQCSADNSSGGSVTCLSVPADCLQSAAGCDLHSGHALWP